MVSNPNARRPPRWEAAGDDTFVDEVVRRASIGSGVLLHGDFGAGQEDLARKAARRLAAPAAPLELMSPLNPATSRSLATYVQAPPSAGPVLLIPAVSSFSGPELDDVARLVLHHHAVVVAAGIDRDRPAAAPFAQLVGLDRVRVPDLSKVAVASFVENGLGGPVSSRATCAVWKGVAGNRARVRMAVEDWLEASFLLRHEGVWVLGRSAPHAGPRLVRHWQSLLAAEDPAVRTVLEVLSLVGEIPLPLLLEVCDADAVDAVYERGLLDLTGSLGRDASLRGITNGEAIASHVPPGRSRSLLDEVVARVEGSAFRSPPGLVAWQVRCGLDVDDTRVLHAVEHLAVTSPAKTVDLLRILPANSDSDRDASVRISALIAAGRLTDAWECARRMRPTPADDVSSVIGPARAADLVLSSWSGDYRPILAAREAATRMPSSLEPLWQQSSHEALAMSGRVDEALRANRELLHMLERSESAPSLIQRIRLGLVDIEFLAGEWTRAATTLAGGPPADVDGLGVVYRAFARVLTADFDDSARILTLELPQLRVLDDHGVLALAGSLSAVSLAATGQRADAFVALAGVGLPDLDVDGIWRWAWSANFFAAQALGLLGREGDAVELLMRCADRDHHLENRAHELLALSAALQWGHTSVLERLEAVAQRTESQFAQACINVVHGLRNNDPESLEIGAAIARAGGQYFFADVVDGQLARMRNPSAASHVSGWEGSGSRLLTRRQWEIVEQVLSGLSSSAIAGSMGISVRTVESHLHQVYTKLGVGSRAELRTVLSNSQIAVRDERPTT
ncbi:helix-turn-helix transcriptional regulator [Flaviflexus huanghaiensis]|uniref:helix-turn-helix transcriptional regulator n=1 Tax=Flaviflexus huanghaiensis TaxID=1111473 RepID=UPI0015F967B5|nr:helix-turn-helix transcriptional regulator [Flaviflexus huanghaiensis]